MEGPFGILMPGAMDGFQVALGGADRTQLFHPEAIHREPKWLWFLQTQPATPPNSGQQFPGTTLLGEFGSSRLRGGREQFVGGLARYMLRSTSAIMAGRSTAAW